MRRQAYAPPPYVMNRMSHGRASRGHYDAGLLPPGFVAGGRIFHGKSLRDPRS
jgi:hypothetical protein